MMCIIKKRIALVFLLALALMAALLTAPVAAAAESPVLNASGTVNRTPALDPARRTEGFSAVLYNNTNGLPTSEANAIAETSDGFLWIGSYSGLIRYDGNTFMRIDSTTGISGVMCLYVDSRDRLWIGTNDNGVAMMEKGALHLWGKADGLKAVNIRAIAEDEQGVIYIATTSGIMTVDADLNLRSADDPLIENAYMRDLRRGSDGLLYGLTQLGDLFSMKDGAVLHYLDHERSAIGGAIGIMPDPEVPGRIYVGTENSQVYIGSLDQGFETFETREIAPLSYVERFEYIGGRVWICAGNGIGVLDSEGFSLLENVPMDNSVCHVMTDYAGNLWFTSSRQGVMKIVPNRFSDLYERYGLPSSVVNSTCLCGGQLFIATDSGLTVVDENGPVSSLPLTGARTASGTELEVTDLVEMLAGCRIRSIIRDSRNRLWIATWRKFGLLRYDHGELVAFTTEDGLFSDRVRTVYERADGSILVVNTGGVSIIEGDQVTAGYGEKDGILNIESLTVAEGKDGDIVLGSDGGGIYILSDQGTRHIGTEDGLGSEVVMRIKRARDRDLFWIVTSNSLAYMTDDYKVTTIQQFPYSNNFDLYENSYGDVWILASNGIYVLPAEELVANGDMNPNYYGRDNGLPCIATANSYSELTPEGDLYIASSTGVTKVNIEEQFEDVSSLKVTIPYLIADNVRIYPDEEGRFVIPSSAQKVTISSYVFNYSLINPQVSFRLDGFEQEDITVKRSDLVPVDYTNLRGGTYNYVLRLQDSMGRGNREVSIQIIKEKAFYEQTWFYIVVGVVAVALLVVLVRFYTRRKMRALEKKNHETMTFVREITEAFAKVVDMKDKYTNGHSTRVAQYTTLLATELGYDEETVERYNRIALLHDIGKIGVPPEVLNKPGKLTDEEFEVIKSHTTQGYEALKEISIMPELAVGAQSHHERPDGRGYPDHLKGDEIPRVAQIIAVADCFDAMYSNRPYRNRMNFEKVVSIIKEVSGTQLASDVVDAFLRLVEKGYFRAADDHGGGSTENIENIRGAKKEEKKDQAKKGE